MTSSVSKKKGFTDRFLDVMERMGNKLPDPLILFVIVAVAIVVLSWIFSVCNITAISPVDGALLEPVNLLSKDGVIKMLSGAVGNFTSFAPLGLILVCALGVGLGEKVGLYEAAIKAGLSKLSNRRALVVATFIFLGIIANAAGDAGFLIMPTLGALVFPTVGLSPIAGILVGYASVAGGLSANVIVALTDVICASFTTSAAQLLVPDFVLSPTSNYFFLIVSTVILTVVSTWLTLKVLGPRTSKWMVEQPAAVEVDPVQRKGIFAAGISLLIFLAVLLLVTVPQGAMMRHPENGGIFVAGSPLMNSIVPIMALLFFVPSITYGIATKTITRGADLAKYLTQAMGDLANYIVLAFVASQFVAYFNWSNIGSILAVKGAEFLQTVKAPIPVLLILVIIFTGVLNLLVGSLTAKWAMMAPILVPMFMLIGIHPAATQMAYRIGDSVTNVITPLFPYMVFILAQCKKYDKDIGIGTVITNMMPFSICFFLFWSLLLVIWCTLGLPLGIGGPVAYIA